MKTDYITVKLRGLDIKGEIIFCSYILFFFSTLHDNYVLSSLNPRTELISKLNIPKKQMWQTLGYNTFSCTPDREILRFTPCKKFLSHPCYLTPGSFCVQVFFFNIGCIGRHVISSFSAHVTMTSKRFKSKWRIVAFF